MGRLQGVMWDRTVTPAVLTRIDPVVDTAAAPLFDLMSYCAPENSAWLSAYNWSRAFQTLRDYDALLRGGARRLEAALPAGSAIVFGVAGPSAGRIAHVLMPDGQDGQPASEPGSTLRLRALDAAGAALADVGVALTPSSEGEPGVGTFAGAIPASAAVVELVRDGVVLDRFARSAAPTVRLVAPAAGLRVRSSRPLTVRWQAGDSDSPALEATVDYSPDNGRSWRTVQQGSSTGSATIPASFLAAAKTARVRVAVSDGFNEAQVISAAFGVRRGGAERPHRASGRPRAAPRRRAPLLVGAALDDLGRDLRGRSLTWFAGNRRLGTGEQLTVALPAGRYPLRLVARDGRGLTGEARASVRVAPARLELDALVAPDRVRPAARSVAVRVRASAPARFRVAGRSFAVGTTARRILIPLPRRPPDRRADPPLPPHRRGPRRLGTVRGTFQVPRF